MATEADIILNGFYLLERDTDSWAEGDDEYTVARGIANLGIDRWEHYENTRWRELLVSLEDSTTGDKTTDGTNTYDCPTNFMYPSSYVRVNNEFYDVKKPESIAKLAQDTGLWCYFTGNKLDGYKLKFNKNLAMSTGETIDYEYYKSATRLSAVSSVTEIGDPYFLSYFVASRMGDELVETNLFTEAETRLEQMKTANYSGYTDIDDSIESVDNAGFGE